MAEIGKIAVVGGGIVGRIAADTFRQKFEGTSVTHFTGSAEANHPPALFLWSSALRALKRQNSVLECKIRKIGVEIERMDLHAWSGARLSSLPVGAIERGGSCRTRVVTSAELLEKLPSTESIAFDVENIENIEKSTPGSWKNFRLTWNNGEKSGDFNLVFVAAGSRSKFRAKIQEPPASERYIDQDTFVGITELSDSGADELPVGSCRVYLGSRERIWMTRLGDKIAWQATVKRARGVRGPRVWDMEGLRTVFHGAPPLASDLLRAATKFECSRHVMDLPPVRPLVRGHFGLLGDSAHCPTSDLGFGACLGIEGAMTLTYFLEQVGKNSLPPEAALRAYEAFHFPRAARLVEASRAAALLSMPETRLEASLRDLSASRLFATFARDDLADILAYDACPAS